MTTEVEIIFLHKFRHIVMNCNKLLCHIVCIILYYTDCFIILVLTGSDILLGDGLVIVSATLYAISNLCQEYIVKNRSRVEFLGMVGLFGTLFSGIQLWDSFGCLSNCMLRYMFLIGQAEFFKSSQKVLHNTVSQDK